MVITVAAASLLPAAGQPAVAQPGALTEYTSPGRPGPAAGPEQERTVTLVTGDVITVKDDGSNQFRVRPTPGRENRTFVSRTINGHLEVIPDDAVALINEGKLDPRLFDITGLMSYRYDDRSAALPLIVAATDGSTAAGRAPVKAASTPATTTRELPALGAVAVKRSNANAVAFWKNVTRPRNDRRSEDRNLTPGIRRIWLDGRSKVSLDVSVPKIGAPAAWQAGYTGAAVPIGITDSGIDETHPDLAGKVLAAKNFTDEDSIADHSGHGTHVASTIAGTGAASGGKYKGVAPDAKLYIAKVCVSDGSCPDSAIVAGMEWLAKEQHAKIVNMSLGGLDFPGFTSPAHAAVQALTAEYGTLFVVAAGNEGSAGAWSTLGTPAVADEALAVGALNMNDSSARSSSGQLFSSRGPRNNDFAIKPDISAPGQDIPAARSSTGHIGNPVPTNDKYVTMSGTSMATPHVAGAAGLLAQMHPDWSAAQLKAALMASAKPNPKLSAFEQGSGRVDIARAMRQSVTTTPSSVSFGEQRWPHTDDKPVSRTVTYRNPGSKPLKFELETTAVDADGKPVVRGLFTLSTKKLTVPAGGEASVVVTADGRVSKKDGPAGGELTARAGDVVVQTPLGISLEEQSYDLTIRYLGLDGKPTAHVSSTLVPRDRSVVKMGYNDSLMRPYSSTGEVKLRLPKGRYLLDASMSGDSDEPSTIVLAAPSLNLNRSQTVNMDARLGKPLTLRLPAEGLKPIWTGIGHADITANDYSSTTITNNNANVFTAQIGANEKVPSFVTTLATEWAKLNPDKPFSPVDNLPFNPSDSYLLAWFVKGEFPTGLTRTLNSGNLATLTYDLGPEDGPSGVLETMVAPPKKLESSVKYIPASQHMFDLPTRTTFHVNTDSGGRIASALMTGPTDEAGRVNRARRNQDDTLMSIRGGRTYERTWGRGVFGPSVPTGNATLVRSGDLFAAAPSLYTDSSGRPGSRPMAKQAMTVYRDGTLVGESSRLTKPIEVPATAGRYKLTLAADGAPGAQLSTHVETTWSFRSKHVAEDKAEPLPLSGIVFAANLDRSNRAPAGRVFRIPLQVQQFPGSGAAPVKKVTVQASYDDGHTWASVEVDRRHGGLVALVPNQRGNGFVSLRSSLVDQAGNTNDTTVIRAYRN